MTGACLADVGNQVLCLDVDERKIGMRAAGAFRSSSPGSRTWCDNVAAGRLGFTTDPRESATFARRQMIAVGTPPGEDGSPTFSTCSRPRRSIAATWTDRA